MTGFPHTPVIDAHHHLWSLDQFPYRWLAPNTGPARFGDKTGISRDYLTQTYLSDMADVDLVGSVHVQANCGATDPVEETRWLDAVARDTGWPKAIVAEVDLTSPNSVDQIARHQAASDLLRGVRTPAAWDDAGRWRVVSKPAVLSDPAFRKAAQAVADADLVLEMVVVPAQLPEVANLARALPDLQIVINHFGTLELDQIKVWEAGIRDVAAYSNVVMKLSGLWTIDRAWERDKLDGPVVHALDHLTADRLMYGSNMPVEGVNCGIQGQLSSLSQILADMSDETLKSLFHGTAKRVYRL